MRILIINPNSDLEMTQAIQKTAENFAGGEYEVVYRSSPSAQIHYSFNSGIHYCYEL